MLPKAGRISVKVLTKEEAAEAVEQAYTGTLENPAFYVNISNMRVKVLGAVYKQGMYFLSRENQSLGEVLSLAGGVNFEQLGKQLVLIRGGINDTEGQSQADTGNASSASGIASRGTPMIFNMDIQHLADPALTDIVIHNKDRKTGG